MGPDPGGSGLGSDQVRARSGTPGAVMMLLIPRKPDVVAVVVVAVVYVSARAKREKVRSG